MASYASNGGQIMLAIQKLVMDLQPREMEETEVAVRRYWLFNGSPFRGVTIHSTGEQYDDGTIGTQDIGYQTAITFARLDDGDASLSSDMMMAWMELVRRRLQDQRLNVSLVNGSSPAEHVCRVLQPRELTNADKYPNYRIIQLPVVVWLRELPITN